MDTRTYEELETEQDEIYKKFSKITEKFSSKNKVEFYDLISDIIKNKFSLKLV